MAYMVIAKRYDDFDCVMAYTVMAKRYDDFDCVMAYMVMAKRYDDFDCARNEAPRLNRNAALATQQRIGHLKIDRRSQGKMHSYRRKMRKHLKSCVATCLASMTAHKVLQNIEETPQWAMVLSQIVCSLVVLAFFVPIWWSMNLAIVRRLLTQAKVCWYITAVLLAKLFLYVPMRVGKGEMVSEFWLTAVAAAGECTVVLMDALPTTEFGPGWVRFGCVVVIVFELLGVMRCMIGATWCHKVAYNVVMALYSYGPV